MSDTGSNGRKREASRGSVDATSNLSLNARPKKLRKSAEEDEDIFAEATAVDTGVKKESAGDEDDVSGVDADEGGGGGDGEGDDELENEDSGSADPTKKKDRKTAKSGKERGQDHAPKRQSKELRKAIEMNFAEMKKPKTQFRFDNVNPGSYKIEHEQNRVFIDILKAQYPVAMLLATERDHFPEYQRMTSRMHYFTDDNMDDYLHVLLYFLKAYGGISKDQAREKDRQISELKMQVDNQEDQIRDLSKRVDGETKAKEKLQVEVNRLNDALLRYSNAKSAMHFFRQWRLLPKQVSLGDSVEVWQEGQGMTSRGENDIPRTTRSMTLVRRPAEGEEPVTVEYADSQTQTQLYGGPEFEKLQAYFSKQREEKDNRIKAAEAEAAERERAVIEEKRRLKDEAAAKRAALLKQLEEADENAERESALIEQRAAKEKKANEERLRQLRDQSLRVTIASPASTPKVAPKSTPDNVQQQALPSPSTKILQPLLPTASSAQPASTASGAAEQVRSTGQSSSTAMTPYTQSPSSTHTAPTWLPQNAPHPAHVNVPHQNLRPQNLGFRVGGMAGQLLGRSGLATPGGMLTQHLGGQSMPRKTFTTKVIHDAQPGNGTTPSAGEQEKQDAMKRLGVDAIDVQAAVDRGNVNPKDLVLYHQGAEESEVVQTPSEDTAEQGSGLQPILEEDDEDEGGARVVPDAEGEETDEETRQWARGV